MLRKLFGKSKKKKLEEALVTKENLSRDNKSNELEVDSKNIIELNDDKFLDESPIEDFKYIISYNKVDVEIVKYLGNDIIVKIPNNNSNICLNTLTYEIDKHRLERIKIESSDIY